jgi:hypothetical protein
MAVEMARALERHSPSLDSSTLSRPSFKVKRWKEWCMCPSCRTLKELIEFKYNE